MCEGLKPLMYSEPATKETRCDERLDASSAGHDRVHRVAIALTELHPGGMERVVVHLARALSDCGIEPLVICLEGEGELAGELTTAGVPLVALHSTRGYGASSKNKSSRSVHLIASWPSAAICRWACGCSAV